ncbi:hypothetical protein L9F63_022597, partial [Diploptera punctata]
MAVYLTRVKVTLRCKHFKHFSFRMSSSNCDNTFDKTGLVLGVYTSDEKVGVESIKFTNAAKKFNENTNGVLLEHIKL